MRRPCLHHRHRGPRHAAQPYRHGAASPRHRRPPADHRVMPRGPRTHDGQPASAPLLTSETDPDFLPAAVMVNALIASRDRWIPHRPSGLVRSVLATTTTSPSLSPAASSARPRHLVRGDRQRHRRAPRGWRRSRRTITWWVLQQR
jgi:hypothetical protein